MSSDSSEANRAAPVAAFVCGFLTAYMLISVVQARVIYNNSQRQRGKKLAAKRDSTPRTEVSAASDRKPKVSFDERAKSFFLSEAQPAQPPEPPRSAFFGRARSSEPAEASAQGPPVASRLSSTSTASTGTADGCGRLAMWPSLKRATSATSNIPTDIQLPELVFGEQINGPVQQPHSNGLNPQQRPAVLPFSTYAPCRLLDVEPDRADHGEIFEGIRTIAAYYLRADNSSICECIQTFGLNDLLFRIARLEYEFRAGFRTGSKSDLELRALLAAKDAAKGSERAGPSRAEELELVRGVVAALMHELECILHEYLSFNWDRVDEIYEANKHLLRREGLVCAWKSAADLASLPSTPSFAASPQWETDSTTSGSYSNLVELEAELSATPQSESAPYETFDEYMAKKRQNRTHKGASPTSRPHSPSDSIDNSEAEAIFEDRLHSSTAAGTSGQENGLSSRSSPEDRRRRDQSYRRAVRNWRRAKAAATRKVTEDMVGQHRRFLSLRQMFEDLNRGPDHTLANQRQPVILLLGGGMAAGKSTVREIIGRDGFWSKVGKDAVVIEADAIKNRDRLYQSRTRLEQLEQEDELMQHLHEYSTKAAEALLVMAVNQQRDVVFDGTMTWAPFVQQTIAMVRDHKHNYRRGPGLYVDDEGTTFERYWEIDEASDADVSRKRPYRIELLGVTCDTGLAVARGIWRKIRSGRSVPVRSQLRSHRLFSRNFETFAGLVDAATLYHTGSALTTFNKGGVDLSPKVIAHRSSYTRGELLINPSAYESFKQKVTIVDTASCRQELYEAEEPCDGKVPVTHEDEMSTLRHVFRRADRQERKAIRRQPIRRHNSFW